MPSVPITLLLTHSLDRVADLVVAQLGAEHVFRFNSDLWRKYKLRITETIIEIENPAGWGITDEDVAKVYPMSNARASELHPDILLSDEDQYMQEEMWWAINDAVHIFWSANKVVLVQPNAWLRLGKLQQQRIAGKYFSVTPHSFLINRPDALRPGMESVAKSFTFRYGTGNGFYSRRVQEDRLDPACPWFLTDLIKARWDVTIAVVRDQLFAFALDRSAFLDQTIDWRLSPPEHAVDHWKPVELPPGISDGIFAFMREAGSHYARLDFLCDGDAYTFLESNFIGEWGWLDPDGKYGLRDKILHEIDPRTPCVSCPRFLAGGA